MSATIAAEIVTLVRIVSFDEAVKLVESFGDGRAAEGRLEHAIEVRNRYRTDRDTYDSVQEAVAKEMADAK